VRLTTAAEYPQTSLINCRRDYGAASAKQSKQQTELFRSEFDRLGSAPDGAGGSIHLDISETMDFMRIIGGCERWLRAGAVAAAARAK
jgi:hypothetical protein